MNNFLGGKPLPKYLFVIAGFFAVTYLLYLPSFRCEWVMDDIPVIVENLDIRSFANFFKDRYPGRPLREFTYLLDYALFGLQPSGYHVQHLFWHALNGSLLFGLARYLGCHWLPSALAALLFLVHPIQVEVVANISHRKDSLCLAFSLAALLFYLKGRSSEARQPAGWWTGAMLCWGVALLAKEVAIAFPLVVLLMEVARIPDSRRRMLTLSGLIGAGLAGTAAWIAYAYRTEDFSRTVAKSFLKMGELATPNAATYYQTVVKGWAVSFYHLLWPVDLTMEYAYPVPSSWFEPAVIAGVGVATVALIALFLAIRSGSPALSCGMILLICYWLPTSNLFGYLNYYVADRYLYSPFAGMCLIFAGLPDYLLKGSLSPGHVRRQRCAIIAAACLGLLLCLGWLTHGQLAIWTDKKRFFQNMLTVNPKSLEGLIGMGGYFLDNNQPSEALGYFQTALKSGHSDYRIYSNLGSTYSYLGRDREAMDFILKAIGRKPEYASFYTNLGSVHEKLGAYEEAVVWHRRALSKDPDYGRGHYNLGVALYRLGKKDEALQSFSRAISLLPEDGDALFNFAITASEVGRNDLAHAVLPRLLKINPGQAALLQEHLSR